MWYEAVSVDFPSIYPEYDKEKTSDDQWCQYMGIPPGISHCQYLEKIRDNGLAYMDSGPKKVP